MILFEFDQEESIHSNPMAGINPTSTAGRQQQQQQQQGDAKAQRRTNVIRL